jgi:hypothetical protein
MYSVDVYCRFGFAGVLDFRLEKSLRLHTRRV